MKVGDRVRILYAGGHTYLIGRTGTIIVNDYADKYDFKVKVDGHMEFYFYKDELEVIRPLDSATPGEQHRFRQRGVNIAVES